MYIKAGVVTINREKAIIIAPRVLPSSINNTMFYVDGLNIHNYFKGSMNMLASPESKAKVCFNSKEQKQSSTFRFIILTGVLILDPCASIIKLNNINFCIFLIRTKPLPPLFF